MNYEKHLKSCKATDLKHVYSLISTMMMCNMDFAFVADAGKEDIGLVIADFVGKKIPFSYDSIISGKDLELYREFRKLDRTKVLKAKCVELLARFLESDTLFEGVCLVSALNEELMKNMFRFLGAEERYLVLLEDPIYVKRKAFCDMLCRYAVSAANLYGVLDVMEFMNVVDYYESLGMKPKGYTRKSGSYQNTFLFSPEWFCMVTVMELVGNCAPGVLMTMDGMLVNPCFQEDVELEQHITLERLKTVEGLVTENDLDNVKEELEMISHFRFLHNEALGKEMYLPSKNEFLKYEDSEYYEVTEEDQALVDYLKRTYKSKLNRHVKSCGITVEECLWNLVKDFHKIASDMFSSDARFDAGSIMNWMIYELESMGIFINNINSMDELASYVFDMYNACHMWVNRGNSPNGMREVYERSQRKKGKKSGKKVLPKIVPMSIWGSDGALDTENDRDDVCFDFDEIGKMKAAHQPQVNEAKVYPNDPCPCGSGKKYKKCCGKK